jgi:hypothetical protein
MKIEKDNLSTYKKTPSFREVLTEHPTAVTSKMQSRNAAATGNKHVQGETSQKIILMSNLVSQKGGD